MRVFSMCLQAGLVAITLLAAPSYAQQIPALPPVSAPIKAPASASAPAPAVVAPPAAAPAPTVVLVPNSVGAELLEELSDQISQLGEKSVELVRTVTDFPLLTRWLTRVASDQQTQAAILGATWRMLVVMAAGISMEALVRRLLRRPMIAIIRHAPPAPHEELPDEVQGLAEAEQGQTEHTSRRESLWHALRRLPFVLGRFLLDLLPLLALAAIAAGLLASGLAGTPLQRLVIINVLNAYVVWRLVVLAALLVVSPASARLRLLRLDTNGARVLLSAVKKLGALSIGGYVLLQNAVLFGLYRAAHDALLKLLALATYLLFARLVLRSRRWVKQALAAPAGSTGMTAAMRNAIAGAWHRIVLFYLLALWIVWALDVANGFDRLLRFMVAMAVVAVVVRVVDLLSRITFDKLTAVSQGLDESYPGIEARIAAYHFLARRLINLLLGVVAGLGVLLAAGVGVTSWFVSDSLGGRVVSAVGNILATVTLALIIWEGTNVAIERHLVQLTRAAQLSRAARLRTLLPMLRTALFVTVLLVAALVVLSEIGVNVAPLLAGAGVVGLAIGFGSQKLVQDIITGLFLLLENAMQVGDVVTLGGLSGTVENLSIRTIRLRALDGSVHIVPFSAVTTVTNQTRDYAYAVLDLSIGVNEESERICTLLREITEKMQAESPWRGMLLADLEIMGVDKFIDYSYILKIRIKTLPMSRWAVMRELNRRIKERFDALAIESPMTSYHALGMATPVVTTIIHQNDKQP